MNYKQIIEYLKMQNYTDDQIKRSIIFLDSKENYQVTTQINQEIINSVETTNKEISNEVLKTNEDIINSVDPIEQIKRGEVDLNNIGQLSPNVYDSDVLRNVLADAIINMNGNDIMGKIQNYSSSMNGLNEIVFVNDMIKHVIPPHKEKDKLFLDVVSTSIKEQFPDIAKNLPSNLDPSPETIDFIKSISSNKTFKTKEDYVDLQKNLHNIKDDIYSLNGLSNVVIDTGNIKDSFKDPENKINKAKGLYEIHELVQVYAANELLQNTHKYLNKSLDIKEAVVYLNDIVADDNKLVETSPKEIQKDTLREPNFKGMKEEENENKSTIAKVSTLAILINRLSADDKVPKIDINNIDVSQLEILKEQLANRINIEQQKLEESREKNGLVKETSILSLSLIGLFNENAFAKYITKEEYEDKLIKKSEEFRAEDEIKYKSNNTNDTLDDIKKQRDILGHSYLSVESYERYQREVQRIQYVNKMREFIDNRDLNKYSADQYLNDKSNIRESIGNELLNGYHERIDLIKSVKTGDAKVDAEIDELHKEAQKTLQQMGDAKVNGRIPDDEYKELVGKLLDIDKKILDKQLGNIGLNPDDIKNILSNSDAHDKMVALGIDTEKASSIILQYHINEKTRASLELVGNVNDPQKVKNLDETIKAFTVAEENANISLKASETAGAALKSMNQGNIMTSTVKESPEKSAFMKAYEELNSR